MTQHFPPTGHPEDAAAAAAFVRTVASHRPALAALLRRLLPTAEDVEDVLQETLLHAYLGWGGLHNPEQVGAWLRTIAYHRAMQWQRRRYAETARWPRLWQPGEDDGGLTATPERLDVVAALGLLPPADRSLLLLRHVEGLTAAAIAKATGEPAATVRSRLHRATRRLRTMLETMDDEGENSHDQRRINTAERGQPGDGDRA